MKILIDDQICNKLDKAICEYQERITLSTDVKGKFIRFNVIPEDNLSILFSIYDEKTNTINDKLIIEHDIEFTNKNHQIDAIYIRLQLDFIDDIYKIIK
jgi:hypothetical protein